LIGDSAHDGSARLSQKLNGKKSKYQDYEMDKPSTGTHPIRPPKR
jgi:hypothetical protein